MLRGLSQRELAKRAGVTNSTISLIESNGTNPSVGALKRILDREDKKQADLQALIEQRKFLSDVRSKRLESMSRGVQA